MRITSNSEKPKLYITTNNKSHISIVLDLKPNDIVIYNGQKLRVKDFSNLSSSAFNYSFLVLTKGEE